MNEITDREVEDWFDSIDAAVFSGDTFLNKHNRRRAREYMAAWEREFERQDIADWETEDGEEVQS